MFQGEELLYNPEKVHGSATSLQSVVYTEKQVTSSLVII